MKKLGILLLLCVFSGFWAARASAQAEQRQTVRGIVQDDLGPVAGATVSLQGTANGTMTGPDGAFTLNNVAQGDVIGVSFMGYLPQQIAYTGQTMIRVVLQRDSQQLGEVVVTALGIRKEAKSIGYSIQELSGSELVESRESNVMNALSGKVAGLQVIRSSNGVGGSSKIVLRGNNSLTGNNQPLIVVDNIPIDNFTGGVDDPWGNNGRDMGSGLADINQEDIESITVLKGASAAALYGSRAGNGVILITTKSGAERPGLGITFHSELSIESPFMRPQTQQSFGQGADAIFDPQSTLSWGPKIEGQTVTDWSGDNVTMRAYDNFDAFFQTGISTSEGVSFQQNINGTSVFASVNRADNTGTTPNATLRRSNFNLRATSYLDKCKRWQIDVKANYIYTNAQNRPILGINPSNAYYTVYTLPVSIDMARFRNNLYDERGDMLWWQSSSTPNENPFWVVENIRNQDRRDRLIGGMKLKYKPTEWLDLEVGAGTDYYNTISEEKIHAGSPNFAGGGRYKVGHETFRESNYNFLAIASRDNLIDRLSGAFTLGGNIMRQERTLMDASSGELVIRNYFSLNNGVNPPSINAQLVADGLSPYTQRQMNSLYGMINLNWDDYLYFDVTGRNDWTSTLAKGNNSYFYPSFNLALIVSDMLRKQDVRLPSWITFLKLRASYAVVGNDLDPYQLYNVYTMAKNNLGYNVIEPGKIKFNSDILSERIKSWEAGLDFHVLDGRLGLDFTWYKKNATNQLLSIPMHPFTGYESRIINAGNIQNQGVEVTVRGSILRNPNGLNWDAALNFAKNKDKIIELTEGISVYQLHARSLEDIQIVAEATGNHEYGAIYGKKYLRVEDASSPHYGKIIVDDQGLPLFTAGNQYLGNQSPKAMLGISNDFTYRGFTLGLLVDMRFGGKIYSATNAIMSRYGTSQATAANDRAEFVMENTVVAQGGSYVDNTVAVTPQRYWQRIAAAGGNFGLGEEFIYDATNVRLRNITLGYNFDQRLLAGTPFQRARLSFTCNNVWMIYSRVPGIDPESVVATNTNAVGIELNAAPTSRTFVFSLTLGF